MMITIPDPNPGRCLNMRRGNRCLDYDNHDGRCQFEDRDPNHDLWWQTETRGWSLTTKKPKPWVSPLGGSEKPFEKGKFYYETPDPCGREFMEPHNQGRTDVDFPWCPGGTRTEVTKELLMEHENAVAVTLRREWPDVLNSTDEWRPIIRRAISLLNAALVEGGNQ